MLNRKINFTAGDQSFSMEPFTVRLQSYANACRPRGLWSLEEELKKCLLLQARDNYTTFTGRFDLSLVPGSVEEINLDERSRNTLVIINEVDTPTFVEVRVACGALITTALEAMIFFFFLLNFVLCFCSQFKDINKKPAKGNNAIRLV